MCGWTPLAPSDTVTHCPYKGTTVRLSAQVDDLVIPNVAWSCPPPLPETERIAGRVAFYNDEPTVAVTADGQREA